MEEYCECVAYIDDLENAFDSALLREIGYILGTKTNYLQPISPPKKRLLLLQNPTLAILHTLKVYIFKDIPVLFSRFFQRIFHCPHLSAEEPTYQASSLFHLVMCCDPVLCSKYALCENAVLRSQVELLGRGYRDIVEAV